jgi:hypothetical protein
MSSLSECLFEARCGPISLQASFTWAYAGRLLGQQRLIRDDLHSRALSAVFERTYTALRWALPEKELEAAKRAAWELLGSAPRIMMNPPSSWPPK